MSFPFLSSHLFQLDLTCRVLYKSVSCLGRDWEHRRLACIHLLSGYRWWRTGICLWTSWTWGPLTPGLGASMLFFQITYETSIFFKSIMNEQNWVLVPCVHFSIRSLYSRCLWYWLTSNKSSYGWQHWLFYDIPGQQALAQALPNFIQHWGYGGSGFSLHHSKWMSGQKFQMTLFYMILYLFTPSSKTPPIFSKVFSPVMSLPCTMHPKPSLSCSPQTPKVHWFLGLHSFHKECFDLLGLKLDNPWQLVGQEN